MAVRIRASLVRVKGKKNRAIQLALNAGFRNLDSITGDVKYRSLKIQLPKRVPPQYWDLLMGRPTDAYCARDKYALHRYIDEHVSYLQRAHELVLNNPLIDVVTPEEVKRNYLQLTGQLRTVQVQSRMAHFVDDYISRSKKEKPATQVQFKLLAQRLRQFEAETKQACYGRTTLCECTRSSLRG